MPPAQHWVSLPFSLPPDFQAPTSAWDRAWNQADTDGFIMFVDIQVCCIFTGGGGEGRETANRRNFMIIQAVELLMKKHFLSSMYFGVLNCAADDLFYVTTWDHLCRRHDLVCL